MEDLSLKEFGRILDFYKGKGVLKINGIQEDFECEYEIAQFTDGEVRAKLKIEKYIKGLEENFEIESFLLIEKDRTFDCSKVLVSGNTNGNGCLTIFTNIIKLKINLKNELNHKINKYEFYITNMTFLRNFELKIKEIKYKFKKIPDYNNLKVLLKWDKKTIVTSKLIVDIEENFSLDEILNSIDTLLEMLSFSLGCKISWIKYSENENEKEINVFHENRITRVYNCFGVEPRFPTKPVIRNY